jgi:hypothetical protein
MYANSIGFTGTGKVPTTSKQNLALRVLLQRLRATQFHFAHHGDCVNADAVFDRLIKTVTKARLVLHPGRALRKQCRCNDPSPLRCRECEEADGVCYCRCHGYRAFCKPRKGDLVCEPKLFKIRNLDIVQESELLIAAPAGPERRASGALARSGTWQTVRMARRKGIPIFIVDTDGNIIMDTAATPEHMRFFNQLFWDVPILLGGAAHQHIKVRPAENEQCEP